MESASFLWAVRFRKRYSPLYVSHRLVLPQTLVHDLTTQQKFDLDDELRPIAA
jgi:hypothetical protein